MPHSRAAPLPSIPASVFLILSLVVPIGFGHTLLNADGDPARHLRHGRDILAQGQMIRVDHFSLLHQGQPYVDMEYGTQIILALIEKVAGLAGVVVFATLLIATAHALVARFLLRRGVDPLFAYGIALLSAMVGHLHWLARPHLVTMVLTVLLLDWLDRDRPVPRYRFILLFLLWANLHAGFLFGLTLIGFYVAGHVLHGLVEPVERPLRFRLAGSLALTGALAGLATLFNAYGPGLHLHAFSNLSDPYLTDHTIEFMSPDFHWSGLKFFLAVIAGIIAAFGVLQRPVTGPHLLVITATIASALLYQRNVTLVALTGLPLAALYLQHFWNRLPGWRFRLRLAAASRAGSTAPWVAVSAALAGVLALGGIIPNQFDRSVFPVDIVREARDSSLGGRMFNDFRYGGYLQYAWPEQKVFIDGATDVYGPEIMRAYYRVLALQPGWRDSLTAWRIDLILVPTLEPLASELLQDGTWGVWRCDDTAVLLRPSGSGPPGDRRTLEDCLIRTDPAPDQVAR